MRIEGYFLHNGARFGFVSLEGNSKWVFYNLLKYMKNWAIPQGTIYANGKREYDVFSCNDYIRIYRCKDGYMWKYKRDGCRYHLVYNEEGEC